MTDSWLVSWFEADCTTGSATIQFADTYQVRDLRLRGYAVRGLNGTWPSTMKIRLRTQAGLFVGQSLQANVTQDSRIGIVLPLGDTSDAHWFEQYGPVATEGRPVPCRTLTVQVYEQDGTTVLTGTDIKLYFEVTYQRSG